jgi:hypothetical protein
MSDDLDPDVLSVLRKATPVEVDAASRARVLAGVDARIAMLPSNGGGGSQSNGGAPNSGISRLIASKPILSLALALAVGGAAGALLRGAPSPNVVVVERVVAAPSPSALASAAPIAAPSSSVAAVDSIDADALPNASARASAPPLDSGAALAAESALLDIARTALARGEPDHALAAIARHAAQFPHGVLVEEREAIAVKALAQAGRGSDAKARADRFRARYPKSMFQTAIDSSLGSNREMDPTPSRQP